MKHYLFSYGTLQLPLVQQETFGRLLKGDSDVLVGYHLENLTIRDEAVVALSEEVVHPIAVYTGDPTHQVEGVIFEITEQELQQVDTYEVKDYRRVEATFLSGKKAWVYVR